MNRCAIRAGFFLVVVMMVTALIGVLATRASFAEQGGCQIPPHIEEELRCSVFISDGEYPICPEGYLYECDPPCPELDPGCYDPSYLACIFENGCNKLTACLDECTLPAGCKTDAIGEPGPCNCQYGFGCWRITRNQSVCLDSANERWVYVFDYCLVDCGGPAVMPDWTVCPEQGGEILEATANEACIAANVSGELSVTAITNEPCVNMIEETVVVDEFTCKGDLDQDGDVDVSDQNKMFDAWGDCPPGGMCAGACCPADLNGDGTVGTADLNILLGNWGTCS